MFDDSTARASESWLDQHGDALYRFAYGRVRDPELAADLVQETFLEGLRSRSSFTGGSSVRTWLTAILKHKIIDQYRRSGLGYRRTEGESWSDLRGSRASDQGGHWKTSAPAGGSTSLLADPSTAANSSGGPSRCVTEDSSSIWPTPSSRSKLGDLDRDRVKEQFQITAANLSVRPLPYPALAPALSRGSLRRRDRTSTPAAISARRSQTRRQTQLVDRVR